MTQLTRRNVILAKIESTYGSDPTPTVGSNAVRVIDLDLKVMKPPVERPTQQQSLARRPSKLGEEFYEVNFKIEVVGSGSAGTAPRAGALLRACGFSETIVTGGSPVVKYRDINTSFESVTIWAYLGGRLHKIVGCVGNVKGVCEAGKQIFLEFSMMGLKGATPAITSVPTNATYDEDGGGSVPICKNGTFSYNNKTTLVTPMMDFDLQNTVTKRPSLSATEAIAGYEITDRNMVASINPETQIETSYDFYGDTLTNQRELSYTAGSIITFTATKFNPYSPEFEDVEGILHDKVSGEITEDSSNGYAFEIEYAG